MCRRTARLCDNTNGSECLSCEPTSQPHYVPVMSCGVEAASHTWRDVGNAVVRAHGVPLPFWTRAVSVTLGEEHFTVVRYTLSPVEQREVYISSSKKWTRLWFLVVYCDKLVLPAFTVTETYMCTASYPFPRVLYCKMSSPSFLVVLLKRIHMSFMCLNTDPLYETVSPATGMLSHLVPNCSSISRYAVKDVAKYSWAPDTRLSLYLFITRPPRKTPTATAGRFNTPRRKWWGRQGQSQQQSQYQTQ